MTEGGVLSWLVGIGAGFVLGVVLLIVANAKATVPATEEDGGGGGHAAIHGRLHQA